jgi:hypothetical protein
MSPISRIVARAIAGPNRWEQHWHCIGLEPMHRALVYRIVLAELAKTKEMGHRILWRASREFDAGTQRTETDLTGQASGQASGQIEWVDVGVWSSQIGPRMARDPGSLRVLWCWNQPNWREFLAVTPWMATGVVYNLDSLQVWVRQSLRLGKWHLALGSRSLPIEVATL